MPYNGLTRHQGAFATLLRTLKQLAKHCNYFSFSICSQPTTNVRSHTQPLTLQNNQQLLIMSSTVALILSPFGILRCYPGLFYLGVISARVIKILFLLLVKLFYNLMIRRWIDKISNLEKHSTPQRPKMRGYDDGRTKDVMAILKNSGEVGTILSNPMMVFKKTHQGLLN